MIDRFAMLSPELLRILDSLDDGILIFDQANAIVFSNKAASRLYRLSQSELAGRCGQYLAEKGYVDHSFSNLAFQTKKSLTYEQTTKWGDVFLNTAYPVDSENRQPPMVIEQIRNLKSMEFYEPDFPFPQPPVPASHQEAATPSCSAPPAEFKSPAMQSVYRLADSIAPKNINVLILGRYGYRRICMELRNRGFRLNHKTVQRLMKESGLKCMVRTKKYRSYRGEIGKVAPYLLVRDFHTERPNQKWVTDITEFSLFGSKLYLSPVLDLYNGEIISYAISERANYSQVEEMLDKAFSKLPEGNNLIFHSDQGWQYQNARYQKRLLEKGVQQSMSRKGNCLDNAVMKNFFGLLKSELLYLRTFQSLDEFWKELIAYLDYYNHNRIKEKLNGLSPVQYRIQSSFAA